MSSFDALPFSHDEFCGKIRLFPLPNLVLYPHVMQPLHLFEPRYRAMFEDALASDKLIATALLAPGWERRYEGRPRLHGTTCLGRVISHHQLSDGTYNILLLGLSRARVVKELPPHHAFREAWAELVGDIYPPQQKTRHSQLQRRLHRAMRSQENRTPDACEQLDQLMDEDVPLGMLTDILSFTFDLDIFQKQAILEEANVYRRADRLLDYIDQSQRQYHAVLSECNAMSKFSNN